MEYTDYLLDQWKDIQAVCSTSIPVTTKSSTLYVGPATSTTPVARRAPQITARAVIPRSIPGYADLGCYTDADSRTLPETSKSADDMSLDVCASFCSTAGYKIFGVENGNECWCSNQISSNGAPQSSSACTALCAGNSQQICGGGWALNVYSSTTAAAPTAAPTLAVGSLSGYKYVGCYSDADSRTLGDRSMSDTSMTLQKCADFCSGEKMFGLEYGQECWCGNSLNPIATISTSCDKGCSGAPNTQCGGGWAIDVFSVAASQTSGPVSTEMPTTTKSVPPAATTCPGQLVKTADPNGLPFGCAYIAEKYRVSTGAVIFATNDNLCDVDTTICLPLPCQTERIGFTESCDSLVKKYSTDANNLTRDLFLSWNPNIIGFCQNLLGAQYVCKGPPGGEVSLDAPVYNPTGTTGYYTTAVPPQPTSTGTTESCGLYHSVVQGDICQTICLRYGISFEQFLAINKQLLPDCSNTHRTLKPPLRLLRRKLLFHIRILR